METLNVRAIEMTARNLWPLAAAVVAGFTVLPIAEREYTAWSARQEIAHQQSSPVVKMAGRITKREGASVWLHIRGSKLRECRYAGINAYAIDSEGVRHDANIERADEVLSDGATKAPGVYDLGIWRVWPVTPDARRVMVAVEHICGSVAVRSVIAEVSL
jgi:hypothetical protein